MCSANGFMAFGSNQHNQTMFFQIKLLKPCTVEANSTVCRYALLMHCKVLETCLSTEEYV